MSHDWTEIGENLGGVLSLTDFKRREVAFAAEADGLNFEKDVIVNAFDLTDADQIAAAAALNEHVEESELAALRGIWSDWITKTAEELLSVFDVAFVLSDADRSAGPYAYTYDETLAGQGQIAVQTRSGFLAAIRQALIDEGLQVQRNVVTMGALAAVGTPTGSILLTSATGQDFCLSGTFRLECVSDIVEAVQFQVTHDMTSRLADGTRVLTADRRLQVAKAFADENTGVAILLSFNTPTITTDPSALFSLLTITNATDGTTDKGRYYVKVTRNTGDVWLVELFKDSSLTNLVGSDATASGVAGLTAITIQTQSGSVAVTINKANAAAAMPVVGNTYAGTIFNMRIPRVGDKWEFTSSNDEAGAFATKLAKIPGWRIALPSGAAASVGLDNSKAPDLTLP